jgi:hypothetical protein
VVFLSFIVERSFVKLQPTSKFDDLRRIAMEKAGKAAGIKKKIDA